MFSLLPLQPTANAAAPVSAAVSIQWSRYAIIPLLISLKQREVTAHRQQREHAHRRVEVRIRALRTVSQLGELRAIEQIEDQLVGVIEEGPVRGGVEHRARSRHA